MKKPPVKLSKDDELAIVNNDTDRWTDIAKRYGIPPARVSYLKSVHRWEDQRAQKGN